MSIISNGARKAIFPRVRLSKSHLQLKSYTGEPIPMLGKFTIDIEYYQQHKKLDLIVVAGKGLTLLGRSWLQQLRLDWMSTKAVSQVRKMDALEHLLSKHSDLFKDELGTIHSFQAKLHIQTLN